MLFLLAPSKTQDFDKSDLTSQRSDILFPERVLKVVNELQKLDSEGVKNLMKVSDMIADDVLKKIRDFEGNVEIERQALLAYTGQVYKGFELSDYSEADFEFVQKHLLILSGFYGAVRPLDLIRPYRLEMQAKLSVGNFKNLYELWRDSVTDYVNNVEKDIIVNLASQEYFSVLDRKKLKAKVITPVFKDEKDGKYRVVAIFAKQARGEMVNFAVRERISKPEELKKFNKMGYQFSEEFSSESELVFLR